MQNSPQNRFLNFFQVLLIKKFPKIKMLRFSPTRSSGFFLFSNSTILRSPTSSSGTQQHRSSFYVCESCSSVLPHHQNQNTCCYKCQQVNDTLLYGWQKNHNVLNL